MNIEPGNAITIITDEELYDKYDKYCWWYARYQQRNFHLTDDDVFDIVQDSRLKLVKCPQHLRPFKKVITTIVNNCTRDWLELNKKRHQNNISLSSPIQQDTNGEFNELSEIIPDKSAATEETLSNKNLIEEFWNHTDGEEQLLIVLVLGLDGKRGRSFAIAAKQLGLTEKKAIVIYENAMDRLRALLL